MNTIVLSIILVILLSTIFCAVDFFLFKNPKIRKKSMISHAVSCGVQLLLIAVELVVSNFFMAKGDNIFPVTSFILMSLFINLSTFIYYYFKNERLKKYLKRFGIALLVTFLCEIFVFNAKSFTTNFKSQTVDYSGFTIATADKVTAGDNCYDVNDGGSIEITNPPEWARAFTIDTKQAEEKSPYKVSASIKDNNFSTWYQLTNVKSISGYGKKDVSYSVHAYKKLIALKLDFSSVSYSVQFNGVTFYNKIPYSFSQIRFNSIILIILAVFLIKYFKISSKTFDYKNRYHLIALCLIIALSVASAVKLFAMTDKFSDQLPIKYDETFNVATADIYAQEFDALKKGQVYLDIEPSDSLKNVPSDMTYDRSYLKDNAVDFQIDRAYYNGKYYSYFGIIPVLLYYFPYFSIHKQIPTLAMATNFFSVIGMIFFCLMLLTIIITYCKKPNLLLTMLGFPTALLFSGSIYCMDFPNMYDVAVASGTCFVFICIFFGLLAADLRKLGAKILLFIISGISFILSLGSRPSSALMALILAPAFIRVLAEKNTNIRVKIASASSFLVPVILGGTGLCYYNYLRFDQPFNFGAKYQETISNMSAYKLQLSEFSNSIYNYFFTMPAAKDIFPYFTYSMWSNSNYQMFNNIEINIGACLYPFILLAFIMLFKSLRKNKYSLGNVSITETKAFSIFGIVLSILISWAVFCLAGVSVRYAFDFMPLLATVSLIIILQTCSIQNYARSIAVFSLISSFIIQFLLLTDQYLTGLVITSFSRISPTFYETLEDMVIFWC